MWGTSPGDEAQETLLGGVEKGHVSIHLIILELHNRLSTAPGGSTAAITIRRPTPPHKLPYTMLPLRLAIILNPRECTLVHFFVEGSPY